jgi:uncharacterized protein YecE (DUF72 family)
MESAHIGTSGFAYDEWRGGFYPPGLAKERFLEHYASRLSSVEIDSTFYRMPSPSTLEHWIAATPAEFRFSLKASRRITHFERLAVPSETLDYLVGLLPRLGERLGPVLFQLPPFLRCEVPRLASFLDALPPTLPVAIELRDPSWHVEEVFALLEKHGAAFCIDDRDGERPPVRVTGRIAYVRLRRERYSLEGLERWIRRFRDWVDQGVDVHAFVKHEGSPAAPGIAEEIARRVAATAGSRSSRSSRSARHAHSHP